ncbi:MAG: helix-turn-helix domain-containing protein [Anaerolineae bacterium]
MPTDLTFGAWLKRQRREQGLTQEALAGLAGCSTDYLKKIEAGRRQPSRPVVDALLDALQIRKEARPTYVALAFATPPPPPHPPPPRSLPAPLTSFIGREAELAAVEVFLRRKATRFVTLTGPGGVGKTRLALAAAANALDEFADGAHFVDLAPITDPNLVASAVADALGIRVQGTRSPLDALKDGLRDKRLLLVLDNFEQVLAASPLVPQLLVAAPGLKVLVTSRVVLHLRGEQEFPVPPLPLPDLRRLPPLDGLSQYAAIALFAQRAASVRPDFGLTDANAPFVAAICHRLDGLPLAIELAAARVKVFSPPALLQRLDSRLKTLTLGPRDAPTRHQALRDAIAWSYDLLTEPEKRLFRRLGVFVGGFTLEAAEAVCHADGSPAIDVGDGVSSLVDKSLVQPRPGAAGELRFAMLETIREYALEQLAAQGETGPAQRAHAQYFLALAETAESELPGPGQAAWLHRLAAEQDNLRAAQSWTLSNGDVDWALRFVGALWRFWFFRGDLRQGSHFAEEVLAAAGPDGRTATHAKALWAAGWLVDLQGFHDRSVVYAEASAQIFMVLGDRRGAAHSLHLLALNATEQGDLARAYALHQQTLPLFQAIGDERGETFARNGLGLVAAAQGDYATARGHFAQSAAIRRRLGDKSFLAYSLGWLALVSVRLGDLDAARAALEEGVAVRRELGDEGGLAASCEGLAAMAAAEGKAARAARLFGAAERVRERAGNSVPNTEMGEYRHNVAVARSQMAEDEFAAAWAEGRAMSLDEALALALATAD